MGAAGVMIAPPPTLRTDDQIVTYFARPWRPSARTCRACIQDYPLTTGVVMSPGDPADHQRHPSCVMLKHEDWPGLDKITALRRPSGGACATFPSSRGNGGLFLAFEMERGADGAMTGYAFPKCWSTWSPASTGQRDAAHDMFDAHLPLVRYEQQPGVGLAVRKYILKRRGMIASDTERKPRPKLSPKNIRSDIQWLMERMRALIRQREFVRRCKQVWTGKRALVLGASKGLGFGIAQGLARRGCACRHCEPGRWRVRKAPRTRSALTASAFHLRHRKDRSSRCSGACDVVAPWVRLTSWCSTLVAHLRQGARRIVRQWRNSFEAMFVNLVQIADQLLPGMVERKFGRIISVISSGVIQPIPNLAISNAIRPALVGWGKSLAAEVASSGVTVNAIAPGRIATDRLKQLDAANAERTGRSDRRRGGGGASRDPRRPLWRDRRIRRRGSVPREREGVVHDRIDPACRWRSDFVRPDPCKIRVR